MGGGEKGAGSGGGAGSRGAHTRRRLPPRHCLQGGTAGGYPQGTACRAVLWPATAPGTAGSLRKGCRGTRHEHVDNGAWVRASYLRSTACTSTVPWNGSPARSFFTKQTPAAPHATSTSAKADRRSWGGGRAGGRAGGGSARRSIRVKTAMQIWTRGQPLQLRPTARSTLAHAGGAPKHACGCGAVCSTHHVVQRLPAAAQHLAGHGGVAVLQRPPAARGPDLPQLAGSTAPHVAATQCAALKKHTADCGTLPTRGVSSQWRWQDSGGWLTEALQSTRHSTPTPSPTSYRATHPPTPAKAWSRTGWWPGAAPCWTCCAARRRWCTGTAVWGRGAAHARRTRDHVHKPSAGTHARADCVTAGAAQVREGRLGLPLPVWPPKAQQWPKTAATSAHTQAAGLRSEAAQHRGVGGGSAMAPAPTCMRKGASPVRSRCVALSPKYSTVQSRHARAHKHTHADSARHPHMETRKLRGPAQTAHPSLTEIEVGCAWHTPARTAVQGIQTTQQPPTATSVSDALPMIPSHGQSRSDIALVPARKGTRPTPCAGHAGNSRARRRTTDTRARGYGAAQERGVAHSPHRCSCTPAWSRP